MEKRLELIKRMIQIYGKNHLLVRQFIEVCNKRVDDEQWTKILQIVVESHEDTPLID